MGVIIKFRSDERKNINNLMLKIYDKPFRYEMHIRRYNGDNTGEIHVEKRNGRECENIINDCNVDIISTAVFNEEMSKL